MCPAVVGGNFFDQPGGHLPLAEGPPLQTGEDRPDEKMCTEQCSDRMSRESYHGLARPGPSQEGRLARFHGDTVKKNLTQGGHDPVSRIFFPHRTSTGQDHSVTLRQSLLHRPCKEVLLIGDNAIKPGQSPGLFQQRADQGAVYVPDLAGGGGLLRRYQFVPGGNDPHSETGYHRYGRHSQSGQGADVLGLQPAAGWEHLVSGLYIISTENHVVARGHTFENSDGAVAVILTQFQHLHCIRSLRHFASCGDGGTLPRGKGETRSFTHPDLPGQDKLGGQGVRAAEGVR